MEEKTKPNKAEEVVFVKELGSRIHSLRKKLGMTQRDLSNAVNIAATNISFYEHGIASPRAYNLLKIAKALKTTSSALLDEENYNNGSND